MACRIKIKKKLEETVDTLSQEGEGKSLPLAKQVANKVNNQFNTKVVDFVISGDYIDKVITIPDPLVDAYYDAQVELEVKEDDLTRRKQGNWTTDKEGNVIPYFESRISTQIKPGVQELFDSNPELANQVYKALGFRTPNITVLPNGNLKIVAFRTEKVGPTSKGEYQRGKGLYLSLDRPYPGEDVYTVEIEVSPKNLLDRKLGFGKISEDFFIDKKNKRVDKQLDTLHEFKQSLGIKAEIGSIDGVLMNELVLFDKDLINQALNSKQQYNPQQKQQALQLYSQYLDTGKQDIEGFKEFVSKSVFESKAITKEFKTENKETITTILNHLKKITGIEYEMYNSEDGRKGYVAEDKVFINEFYGLNKDTPFHEYLHPFVRGLKKRNPVLYKQLVKTLVTSADGQATLREVSKNYTELSRDLKIEEAIVEMLGQYAAGTITVPKESISPIEEFFRYVYSILQDFLYNNYNFVLGDAVSVEQLKTLTLEDLTEIFGGNRRILTKTSDKAMASQKVSKINEIESKILTDSKKYKLVEKDGKSWYEDDKGNKYTRVTQFSESLVSNKFTLDRTSDEKKADKFSAEMGTLIHSYLENAIKRVIDPSVAPIATNVLYTQIIEKYAKNFVKSFPEGTKFLTEQIVGGKVGNKALAGTVDLIVITPDSKVSIYDYKTFGMSKTTLERDSMALYKQKQYKTQLGLYQSLLGNYNVIEEFDKARLIPIGTQITKKQNGEFDLMGVTIGDVDVTKNTKNIFNPIPLETEKTGNKEIDNLVYQLRTLAEKAEAKKLTKEESKLNNEKIAKIKKAIQELQLTQSFTNFIELAKTDLQSIHDRLDKLDSVELAEALNVTKFYEEIRESTYNTIYKDKKLSSKEKGELMMVQNWAFSVRKELEERSKEKIKEIASKENVDNILDSSMALSSITKWMRSIDQIDIPIFKTFWKLVNKKLYKVREETLDLQKQIDDKLKGLKKWGDRNGISGVDLFKKIIRTKKVGDKEQLTLIHKYSEEYKQLRKQKREVKDWQWFKNNHNVNKEKLQERIDYIVKAIEKNTYSSDNAKNASIKAEKILDVKQRYDVDKHPETAFLNKDIMRFLEPKGFLSTEYQDLIKPENKELFEFYTFFQDKLKEFNKDLPVDYNLDFIPNIEKDLIEQVFASGELSVTGLKDSFVDMFKARSRSEMGQLNKLTGEFEYSVPIYYTDEIPANLKSTDLGKVLALFGNMAINYKHMKEIEGSSLLLREGLKDSKELVIVDGKVEEKIISADTIELMNEYINYYVYGIKINTKDKTLEFNDTKISINKTFSNILQANSAVALAFNIVSAGANLTGGYANTLMIAARGRFFNRKQLLKASALLGSGPQVNPKAYSLIEYFDVMQEDKVFREANNLSVSKTVGAFTLDRLYALQRGGDWAIQNSLLLAMAQSHTIENNKIVSLKGKPEGTKSLLELAEIKDDKLNLKDLITEEEYIKFRNKTQRLAETALGLSTRENISRYKMSIWGKALMQFRNWIPKMAEERFGDIAYDESLEVYTKGKYITFLQNLGTSNFLPLISDLLTGLGTNTKERAKELYIKELAKNPLLKISEEEFTEMHIENIKAMMEELRILLAFVASIAAISYSFDDDEKKTAYSKKVLQLANRAFNEVSFFLLPTSFTEIVKSPIPAIRMVLNTGSLLNHLFTLEIPGQLLQDEELMKKGQPVKYLYRTFPITNEWERWNDVFTSIE